MKLEFLNRASELKELGELEKNGGLVVLSGRRRVGKTRLLKEWIKKRNGIYTQAIEGHPTLQLEQVSEDVLPHLNTQIQPKSWEELFALINLLQNKRNILCIDEFPYLVSSDPSLPSRFQKWLDHSFNDKKMFLILAGSSQHMMNDTFLNPAAPLFGRASKIIRIKPMTYQSFCAALRLDPSFKDSFVLFSLVGGIPKYWELLFSRSVTKKPILAAESLYFDESSYLEFEPRKILSDEKIEGTNPNTVLEYIGRGAHRLSEIAARMNVPATHLGRIMQLLQDGALITREIPFGENPKNTKKTMYKLSDPSLKFWYQVYSPHRSRWSFYETNLKQKLIQDHASTIFEDFVRSSFPQSFRYWDQNVEFDLVYDKDLTKSLTVGEVKFTKLNKKEKEKTLNELERKFALCALSHQYQNVEFVVHDLDFLLA